MIYTVCSVCARPPTTVVDDMGRCGYCAATPTDPYAAYREKEAANRIDEAYGVQYDAKWQGDPPKVGTYKLVMPDVLASRRGIVEVHDSHRFDIGGIFSNVHGLTCKMLADRSVWTGHSKWFEALSEGEIVPTYAPRFVNGAIVSLDRQRPAISYLPDADYRAAIEHYTAKTIADHDAWLRSIGWMAGNATAEVYGFGNPQINTPPAPSTPVLTPATHPTARVRIVEDREPRMGCSGWMAE